MDGAKLLKATPRFVCFVFARTVKIFTKAKEFGLIHGLVRGEPKL